MTPENALFLRDTLLRQLTHEHGTTKRVIAAVPGEHSDYRPDPKAKTAFDLAWHIASAEMFFLTAVSAGGFDTPHPAKPENVKSPADIANWYEEQFRVATGKIEALEAGQLQKILDFRGLFQSPAVFFLSTGMCHSIHHRGELATYLRPMGGKVPSIYGPSADEQIQRPATA